MKQFKTRYFIKPIYLKWFIGILAVAIIFLSEYIPQDIRKEVEIILSIIYAILFLVECFYLIFKSFDKHDLEKEIRKLEAVKINKLNYSDIYDNEKLLFKYKEAYTRMSDSKPFFHLLKSKEQITEKSNIGNYIMIYIIFRLAYYSIEYLKPAGPNIFIGLMLVCILFCFSIVNWEGIVRKNIYSPVIIGHVLAVYLLFTLGKSTYIKSYGNEELGSYFEKNEYKTQYYVNIFPENESIKNYRLPAEIHVFSQSEEGPPTQDHFGQEYTETYTTKYIILNKVFWPNEGYLYFNDCQLEIGEKILCKDQNGMSWNIELTNEKVK